MNHALIPLLLKAVMSLLSGGLLYADIKKSIEQNKPALTLVAMFSLLVFCFSIIETAWHVLERDPKFLILNHLFNTYVLKDSDSLLWERSQESEQGCVAYIEKSPRGRFQSEANACIEAFAAQRDRRSFELAKSTNTLSALRGYLASGQDAVRLDEVRRLILVREQEDKDDTASWADTPRTREGCAIYLQTRSGGKFVGSARECVHRGAAEDDAARLRIARSQNSLASFRTYLEQCKRDTCDGELEAKAAISKFQEQIERAAWAAIAASPSLESCQQHLSDYPSGKTATLARRCYEEQKRFLCEPNVADANTARAQAALRNSVAVGGGGGFLCGFLYGLAVIDAGLSGTACFAAVGAGSVVAGASAAQEAYNKAILPACVDYAPVSR